MGATEGLQVFHPLIASWFAERVGAPTRIQRMAWPRIAAGSHLLVTSPTGSGKTLAAFLWAIDRLVTGVWPSGKIRVLYVSPLRALNNDVQRNLLAPLDQLQAVFDREGAPFAPVRVRTRSGDTPAAERRQMRRQPPEILITTPESLNILLTSRAGQALFDGLTTVVLDEVHAVAGSKRGTHLISAVERLVRYAGAFQRIALSATVRPLETVARWVGGFEPGGRAGAFELRRREVEVLDAGAEKAYDLSVRLSPAAPTGTELDGESCWDAVARDLGERIGANHSSLIFANSRRVVERVARLINEQHQSQLVFSHHGSLSRELRLVVEERLKAGRLKGIVATNSLELGIDVGAIDEVLLVQTPPSITSTVQRVGRAGHRVGEVSRAKLYACHPQDLLLAAVAAAAVLEGVVEPIQPPNAPLDVLAQVVLSMVASEDWQTDALFDFIRTCEPYRDLSRERFDAVIDMLAGRYAGLRIASLKPRIALDRVDGVLRARAGAATAVYLAGGTIADRGLYNLRIADDRTLLGTLDEEFVWERSPGDTFTLGVQTWRIQRITHNDVLVTPAGRATGMTPFWRAEQRDSDFFLAERIGRFLERADERLDDPEYRRELQQAHRLDPSAADALVAFLQRQRAVTGCALPHRRHLVIEQVLDPQGRFDRPVVILHTTWGGRVNHTLAMVLQAAWRRRTGVLLDIAHDDLCVIVELPEAGRPDALLEQVAVEQVDSLLAKRLAETGLFGARFRENAGRAMLLPRSGFGRRTPLWLHRQRAKELLGAVARVGDFPLVLETYRTCLQDELDPDPLKLLLGELFSGQIKKSRASTSTPSPFAAEVIWQRTNRLMYEDDAPDSEPAQPDASLLKEVVASSALRPLLKPELVGQLVQKLQRTFPGYAPGDPLELIEWVKERLLLTEIEWGELLAAVERDHRLQTSQLLSDVAERVVAIQTRLARAQRFVCAVEQVAWLGRALGGEVDWVLESAALDGRPASQGALEAYARVRRRADTGRTEGEGDLATFLADWLRHHGPLPVEAIRQRLPVEPGALDEALGELVEQGTAIVDRVTAGLERPEVCLAQNLERLLRLQRAQARGRFEPRPLDELPLFLAEHQGLGQATEGKDGLKQCLERLFGYPAGAAEWETEILPARIEGYRADWLDILFAETDLMWLGCGPERVALCLAAERDLFLPEGGEEQDASGERSDEDELAEMFSSDRVRFSLTDLIERSGWDSGRLTAALWRLAWRGVITNDGFHALRKGIASGFDPAKGAPPKRSGRPRRTAFGRWRASRPFPGSWYRVATGSDPTDALDQEERNRERIRILLDRYGVLFRPLLAREMPGLRWAGLFRSLRLMELSGEVISGHFFQHVPGPQFASEGALRRLRAGLDRDRIHWLNASDPASACGLSLEGLDLPPRVATTHLVYHGARPVVIAKRRGRRLELRVEPDHPQLARFFGFLEVLLTRPASPLRVVVVEQINGQPAESSPYRPVLQAMFQAEPADGCLRLRRRYPG